MSLFVSGADTFISQVQRALQQLDPSAMVYHNRIYLDETVPDTGHGRSVFRCGWSF